MAFTYALSVFCLSLRDGVGGFQNVYFLALWLSGLGMAITCYALAGIGRKRPAR